MHQHIFYVRMTDINTPEILTNVQKISRDTDKNFPGDGKFQNLKFTGKFPVPISPEETLVRSLCNEAESVRRISIWLLFTTTGFYFGGGLFIQ